MQPTPPECVIVTHPGEMGPHQDDFCAGCGRLVPVVELSDEVCVRCIADDDYDAAPVYVSPSRGDAHLMAVTAPGVR